jgi:hypothetical protein
MNDISVMPYMLFTLNSHFLTQAFYAQNYYSCDTMIVLRNAGLYLIYIKPRTLCVPTMIALSISNTDKYSQCSMLYNTGF